MRGYGGIWWDMGGYGGLWGIWNQRSARPEGPIWARGSQRAPLAPYPPITPHILPYPTISPHIILY